MDDSLLTVRQVAQVLQVSLSTVYRLAERGKLPHFKIGSSLRFKKYVIDGWLEKDNAGPITPPSSAQHSSSRLFISRGEISEMAKAKSKTRINFGYGAVYQRKTKKGMIRWYLDYRDGKGKRIQKLAPLAETKEDAVLALQEEVRRVFNGFYGIKEQEQRAGFKEFVEMSIENYSKVNKRSWKDDNCRLLKLADFFGDVTLQEISPLDIEKFKSISISKGLSKSTVNRYLAILKRMFNVAITWGKAKDNPMKQVKLYSETDNLKERILSRDEEAQLLASSPEHLAPVLIVALNTGMRRGEILGLTWEQVDLEAKEIRVLRTKSGKPRVVDINSYLFETLLGLKNKGRDGQYVFLNSKTGKPYGKLQRSFGTACKKAGIRNLRFHDLRHTFASRLIERGADIIRVKELLGHSTVRVTERYLHSNREEKKRAVELLCQKPTDSGRITSNLLRICDTGKEEKGFPKASSLFSIN